MAFRRAAGPVVIAALAALALLPSGCARSAESPPAAPPPVLGFLVGYAGECADPAGGITVDRIAAQGDALVRTGLRNAGYTTLFVPCDDPVPAVDNAALRARLAGQGLAVERVAPGDHRVAAVIPAGAPNVVRSQMTRRLMLAESLVFSGEPDRIRPETIDLIGNREVIALVLDARRAPGAPVGAGHDVYSRAVGDSGLLVSLSRGGPDSPSTVSVPIAELNLAGDDTVPATEVWTGRRIHSVAGRLTVELPPGDTALLRIG